MKLKFGRYVLYFGKDKKPEQNPQLMKRLKEISVDVTEPKLTREEKVRKWQSEHKEQINERRRELYNQRKVQGGCVKCGVVSRGRKALHKDGTPYLICKKCREQVQSPKIKKSRGRPKGSKNKRKPGRPKGSKYKVK